MHKAAEKGNKATAELLIRSGADVLVKDNVKTSLDFRKSYRTFALWQKKTSVDKAKSENVQE